jgi:uncharacterized protein
MKRLYENVLNDHFSRQNKIALVAGPRQVGKTTACRQFYSPQFYLNWDNEDDRSVILHGTRSVLEKAGLLSGSVIVFDELHKFAQWKNFLKDFFDSQISTKGTRVVVTGSAHLDFHRKGADSLLGRYFMYRMHPLSVAELLHQDISADLTCPPAPIVDADYLSLIEHGGFPEPFLKRDLNFSNQWRRQRRQVVFREDIRDLTALHDIGQVELLGLLLREQAGGIVNYSRLASKLRVSENSVRLWIKTLEMLYYCYTLPPWTGTIPRGLLKQPKLYLYDWSEVSDRGARNENFIASHLLKATHSWTDRGFGEFGLYHIRTRDRQEVDFLVSRDNKPWMLVETKSSESGNLSRQLGHFQQVLGAPYAFQAVIDAPFVNGDCFKLKGPSIVPARTFLSQLV